MQLLSSTNIFFFKKSLNDLLPARGRNGLLGACPDKNAQACILLYGMHRMVPGERALQRYLLEAERYDKNKPSASECSVTLRPLPPYAPVLALASVMYPRGLGEARMVGMLGVWVEYCSVAGVQPLGKGVRETSLYLLS